MELCAEGHRRSGTQRQSWENVLRFFTGAGLLRVLKNNLRFFRKNVVIYTEISHVLICIESLIYNRIILERQKLPNDLKTKGVFYRGNNFDTLTPHLNVDYFF